MEFNMLLSFLAVAIALTLMPGPDLLFVMTQSVIQDKWAGIFTAIGLCTGLLVHITAATIGISALIYQSSVIFSIVKFAGVAYLFYLAWQAFRHSGSMIKSESRPKRSRFSLFKKGIIMNVLNPKVSLFFLALLPQFVKQNAGNVTIQMLALGILFMVQAFIIFSIVSVFSEKLQQWLLQNEWFMKRINIVEAFLLTAIGINVAISGK
ncbi:LysE family translocator [Halobacillus mangrovi]|uniref:Threonine transporter RhtB n=1 Tax=Halobacillus mangrovi TaxID=402384 RepID=A0A1W5ZV39_9BACI|nr:LysE family translocator [Halobacillus mangrovi]ARI77160.1 threonine transporter RhtB [Halobacillus mangrovi]